MILCIIFLKGVFCLAATIAMIFIFLKNCSLAHEQASEDDETNNRGKYVKLQYIAENYESDDKDVEVDDEETSLCK